jgi:hypothetical protein
LRQISFYGGCQNQNSPRYAASFTQRFLPELAVLTAPAIDACALRAVFFELRLALDAQAHAGDRLAARGRNGTPTFITDPGAFAASQRPSRPFHGLVYTRVNLVLHGTIT